MNGYGWIVLRAAPPTAYDHLPDEEHCDDCAAADDEALWTEVRAWLADNADPYLVWQLTERNNNDRGVFSFSVSRNHRTSGVWSMLDWVAERGPGSYGLFFVHDDEDVVTNDRNGRSIGDHSNVFRVHRLRHGVLTELADPFLGPVWPTLES